MSLCQKCQEIFSGEITSYLRDGKPIPLDRLRPTYHRTARDLQISASQDCHICRQLLHSFSRLAKSDDGSLQQKEPAVIAGEMRSIMIGHTTAVSTTPDQYSALSRFHEAKTSVCVCDMHQSVRHAREKTGKVALMRQIYLLLSPI